MCKMRKHNFLNILITVVVASFVIAADRITKAMVSPSANSGPFLGVRITYLENKGAMMGILANHRWVFMALSIVLLIAIMLYVALSKQISMPTVIVLAAIIGGGIGNMIDRFAYGYVIDFIDIEGILPFFVWVFNVADIFVTCGAVALFVIVILDEIKTKKAKNNEGSNIQG